MPVAAFRSGGFCFGNRLVKLIKLRVDIVDSIRNGITNTDHACLEVGDVGADCDAEIC